MSLRYTLIALLAVGCGPAPQLTSSPDAGTGQSSSEEHEHGDPTNAFCPLNSQLTYANFGRAFMQKNCTGCHASYLSGAARHGAPLEHNFDEQWTVRDHLDHIDQVAAASASVVNTDMPPTPPIPSEEERRKLGEWLACGAP
ncbi:MAG: c-type cytochrome [Myxococcaceae bacterium]